MPDAVQNFLAVIGALWLVCAVALGMFVAACWAVRREVDAEFEAWESEVSRG